MGGKLNSELPKISLWLKTNVLYLDIGKTRFMEFTNKKKRRDELDMNTDWWK